MQNATLLEKYAAGRHWDYHPRTYAEFFARFIEYRKVFGFILDLGCGNGDDVAHLAGKGYKMIGIDISPSEVANARQRHPRYSFFAQDMQALTFLDAAIDAVYCVNVMHYVVQRRAIAEIQRVLKPHGYFFVHFNLSITDHNGNVDYRQSDEEVLTLFREFHLLHASRFSRTDELPIQHTHEILQMIWMKY